MCTYNISVDDDVLEKVKPVLPDNEAVEAWMQSQMDILLLQLAESLTHKPKAQDDMASHARRIANIRKLFNYKQEKTNHEERSYSSDLEAILAMPLLDKAEVPDVVLSLLGAGEPVADYDLNARDAYHQYLMEKYQ
ncbi:MAG: hypothetical protein J5848_06185 [Bacteroidales bacterium]|nr:hypothetical protein [Bacteroidales bacterium]